MARPLVISSASLEYVQVPVSATASGAPVNPTGDIVMMAFKQSGAEPSGSDWNIASWDSSPTPTNAYIARCLVGPTGTVTLADGEYVVWVKIVDAPEIPVKKSGTLVVT